LASSVVDSGLDKRISGAREIEMPVLSVLTDRGIPTEKLKTDLAALLKLSDKQLASVVGYLADSKNPLPDTSRDVSRMAEAVGVDDTKLDQHLSLIRYILTNWRRSGASLPEVEGELSLVGYRDKQLARAVEFLGKLEQLKEKFFVVSARAMAEVSGLPTIDDMSFTWDIRPIFGADSWPSRGADEDANYSNWLAHSNMLIVEITSSSREGEKRSVSVQLAEAEFEELEKLVDRARRQLDVIRAKRII
jgi:hypothetical protein